MQTLPPPYFEERTSCLLLKEDQDEEDGGTYWRQDALREDMQSDERDRDNGGEDEERTNALREDMQSDERDRDNGGEDEERTSSSSEQETDVEECGEIEKRSSGRVGDSEDSTGKQEVRQDKKPAWTPGFLSRNNRDVYHYAGHDIIIYESLDSYGSVMWPAVSYPGHMTQRGHISGPMAHIPDQMSQMYGQMYKNTTLMVV
ncbi:hypothetical protein NHX12_005934 [Muraenolepis orangiensis]|uniref:Uncharacterized protein n=1 Tax=Muraenolepis orangiensis TaxID=630683 RepID=A0A9Q0DUU5_9TELE|nr:hypothetical protein NHX12_005934 [Muraenolepis orangiensis]